MRTCFGCGGDGTEEISLQDGNESLGEKILVSGIVTPCWYCNGTGEVEDGCCCAAHCSCECICGAWDDYVCDCWEG